MEFAKPFKYLVALLLLGGLISCQKNVSSASSQAPAATSPNPSASPQGKTDQSPPPNIEKPIVPPGSPWEPLVWEYVNPDLRVWSLFVFKVIDEHGEALIEGASDMSEFCPKYKRLSRNQKINFWGQLIADLAVEESGLEPLARSIEEGLGIDAVTGQPVMSEGLLQLSYQDVRRYPFCEFDWKNDKLLAVKDPSRTILDPEINLACGVRILNEQIANYHQISVGPNHAYWSPLEPAGNKHSAVSKIAEVTRGLSFCN